jgi:hypothetical protein
MRLRPQFEYFTFDQGFSKSPHKTFQSRFLKGHAIIQCWYVYTSLAVFYGGGTGV